MTAAGSKPEASPATSDLSANWSRGKAGMMPSVSWLASGVGGQENRTSSADQARVCHS